MTEPVVESQATESSAPDQQEGVGGEEANIAQVPAPALNPTAPLQIDASQRQNPLHISLLLTLHSQTKALT
jgi:hypothetical protein